MKQLGSLENESLDKNLRILGVPKIWAGAGAEPDGYNLSYSFLIRFFVSTYIKNVVVKLHVLRLGLHWAFRI